MDNVFACENCGKKFLAKEVLQHDAYCPCGETIIAYSIDAADHIAELEAENKKLSAFITMEHTDPPYDYGDSQDVQFAIRIAELEVQLAAMTAELNSEIRWGDKCFNNADALRHQLAAAQARERWIPVTDIRPKRGQHVRVMATMEYDGEDHWIAEDGTVLEPGNILEWRELPAAPKEDK